MRIAVIGGGIGGLAAALYLDRAGFDVLVLEAAAEIKALGVGINVFPHAVRRLYELGLESALDAVGIRTRTFSYFTRHGQLVHEEPAGRAAGYDWPHVSIHRADLHQVLLSAVHARLGQARVMLGARCVGVEQDDAGVTVHLADGLGPVRAAAAIGCDGIRSAVRRQLYPEEGQPKYSGINMWRGVTTSRPYLGGADVTRVGTIDPAKLVIYPIRDLGDGTQLINWVAEIRRDVAEPNDWSAPGRLADFAAAFSNWRFDWLDIPDLLARSETVLEYPMVERDPLPRWSFGRVTLLGDAAHPMYPRGGNGAAQSIIDAEALAAALAGETDVPAALGAYERERRERTAKVVLANRATPPDHIIELAEARAGSRPFSRLEDVLPLAEREAVLERYRQTAAYDIAAVNGGRV